MATDITDHPEAVRRIVDADVDNDATTQSEVLQSFRGLDAPQITEEIARDIADSILTVERVETLVEAGGELPSDAELDALTGAADDFDLESRQGAVLDSVADRVATVEDVDETMASEQPTTRSEVESALDRMGKEIRGAETSTVVDDVVTVEDVVDSTDTSEAVFREDVANSVDAQSVGSRGADSSRLEAVASEASQEIGAPSQTQYERARAQASVPDDAITPADREDLSSDSSTPINVIRDESGEAVMATGGASQGGVTPEQTAEELGVEYRSLEDVDSSIGLEQSRGEASVTFDGRKIGEVSIDE